MTKSNKVKSKEDSFLAIFEAVVQLEVTRGPGRWKLTDLARISKVTRPLIYYYFGKSKTDIVMTAVEYLGEEYFGISEHRLKMWDEGRLVETVLISRHLNQKAPYGLLFYMTRRTHDNDIGKKLREYEKRYRKKLADFFPKLDAKGVDAIAGVLFGLVTFPDLTDDAVRKSIEVLTVDLQLFGK